MSATERWDVVLRVTEGPLAARGPIVLRGPVVRIGANPGPGGFQLAGYRGLDARQAVITAYDGGSVAVAPVGGNQVRVAPHPNVQWKDIEPLSRPEYLSKGCAVHLGPVGRGATLEFLRSERLGVWTGGQLGSEAAAVDAVEVRKDRPSAPMVVQQATAVRKTRSLVASTVPIWFVGCFGLMAAMASSIILATVLFVRQDIDTLGPKGMGEEYYLSVSVDRERLERLPEGIKNGLQRGFLLWMMEDNAARARRPTLREPTFWDQELFDFVQMSTIQHSEAFAFYRTLDNVRKEYAVVVTELRKAGLPEVFAGIPHRESRYRADRQSVACAKGWWQFMPEVAVQVQKRHGVDMKVSGCKFSDMPNAPLWTPSALTPPRDVMNTGEYMYQEKCRIPESNGCQVDLRTDLELSTRAAIALLKEAIDDPVIAKSGAAVQIAIASHNGGYADGRFGVAKSTNLLPAFKRWSDGKSEKEQALFVGSNILCANEEGPDMFCGSVLHAQTQHYVYPIVAAHLLAACYYGKNYADEIEAFKPWRDHAIGGYCKDFEVPDAATVRNK
jgi:hypothetical protein